MTISLTMLLTVILPILATTILFALMLSMVLLLVPRPKADQFGQKPSVQRVWPTGR